MARLYLSAHEFIKQKPFKVYVPAFYHPHLPSDIKNPVAQRAVRPNSFRMTSTGRRNPALMRQTADASQMELASFSIEIMLDMFQKKIEFELADENDLPEILDGLDWYLKSLEPDVKLGSEHYIAYARLVISWRSEVYKHYYRYMKNNPTVLESLYPNNNKTQNLLHLMSIGGGIRKENLELDPLRAKARPPYDVDTVIPKEVVPDERDDFSMENSYGIGSVNPMTDTGKDFNFEDFLKKG